MGQLQTSPLPVIDMRADGLEVHSRKDKFLGGLKVYGAGNLIDYTGPDGVQRLVDDYRFSFVEQQYTLAGLKAPGGWGVPAFEGSATHGCNNEPHLHTSFRRTATYTPSLLGKPLNATIPSNVQAACVSLGWPCLDPSINTRTTVQHSNYDGRAACGDGTLAFSNGGSAKGRFREQRYVNADGWAYTVPHMAHRVFGQPMGRGMGSVYS